jgi:hypothetical protein
VTPHGVATTSASPAAEAHTLCDALELEGGWSILPERGEASEIITKLADVTASIETCAGQLSRFLDRQQQTGQFRELPDSVAIVAGVTAALDQAADAAQHLHELPRRCGCVA